MPVGVRVAKPDPAKPSGYRFGISIPAHSQFIPLPPDQANVVWDGSHLPVKESVYDIAEALAHGEGVVLVSWIPDNVTEP